MCWGHLRAAPVRLAGQEPTSELPQGREGSRAGRGLGGSRSGPENQPECQQAAQCRGSPRFTEEGTLRLSPRFTEEGTLRLGTVYPPQPGTPASRSEVSVAPAGVWVSLGVGTGGLASHRVGGEGERRVERWLARPTGGGGGGEPGTTHRQRRGLALGNRRSHSAGGWAWEAWCLRLWGSWKEPPGLTQVG